MRRAIFNFYRRQLIRHRPCLEGKLGYHVITRTVNKNNFILLIKMAKRKAGKQGKDQSKQLIKSNSLNAIPVGQSSQISDDLVNFGLSQTQNIPGSSVVGGHGTCPMCCLDVEFANADHLTCEVCNDSYHDSCLDFDLTLMDVIREIMRAYGWICPGCRELAKQTKSSKGKKKYICAKSIDDAVPGLANEVNMLTKRIQTLEIELKTLKDLVTVVNHPTSCDVQPARIQTTIEKHSPSNGSGNPILAPANTALTVHKVMRDVVRRRCNVIVTGLRTEEGTDDVVLFSSLCEKHFSIQPTNIKWRRIDKVGLADKESGQMKPSRLLDQFRSESIASEILSQARQLRRSEDEHVRLNVYISRDMSPEEAMAYEERLSRRQKKQNLNKDRESVVDTGIPVVHMKPGASSSKSDVLHSSPSAQTPVPQIRDLVQFPPLVSGCSNNPGLQNYQSVYSSSQSCPLGFFNPNGPPVNDSNIFVSHASTNHVPSTSQFIHPSSMQTGIHAVPFVPSSSNSAPFSTMTPSGHPGIHAVQFIHPSSASVLPSSSGLHCAPSVVQSGIHYVPSSAGSN